MHKESEEDKMLKYNFKANQMVTFRIKINEFP